MKKYVFLTPAIVGIGGGQIYVEKKICFLKNEGWEVEVFSYYKGVIELPNLEYYSSNIIQELRYPLHYTRNKRKRKILDGIVKQIGKCEQIIIESNSMATAEWAEVVANFLKTEHFIYLISENNKISDKFHFDFFNYKHNKNELAGIRKESLKLLFRKYKEVNDNESYHLSACCFSSQQVSEYYYHPIDKIESSDYNIGSIGRLEKQYVDDMIDEIVKFATSNNNKTINVILLGANNNKVKINSIQNKFTSTPNVTAYFLESVSPIPRNFFKKLDVMIAAAGSAVLSATEMVPTISLDVNDYKPIGILGYTTQQIIFRDQPFTHSISQLLADILINNCCKGMVYKLDSYNYDYNKEYAKHLNFISDFTHHKEYFEFNDEFKYSTDKLKASLFRILGVSAIERIKRIRYQVIKK